MADSHVEAVGSNKAAGIIYVVPYFVCSRSALPDRLQVIACQTEACDDDVSGMSWDDKCCLLVSKPVNIACNACFKTLFWVTASSNNKDLSMHTVYCG